MRELQICKKCLKKCAFKPKKFRKKLESRLNEDDRARLTSCLKICPRHGVSYIARVYENGKRTAKFKAFVQPQESTEATVEKILTAAGA
jgi:Na+-translocating ferredoxin:NAD+ oxidoreductase RNF subunit RnfB